MSVKEPAVESIDLILERGRTLIVAHQFDRAKQLIAGLIATDPDNSAVWRLMALAHLGGKEYREAQYAAEKAVSLRPEDPSMHLLMARILITADRIRDGIDHAWNALRIEPDSVDTHLLIARGLTIVRQDLDRAIWHAEQARDLEPDSARTHYALGSALCALRRRKDMVRARESLETALRIDPQSSVAWNDLGLTELRTHRGARSARAFVASLQLDPQSDTAAHNLPLAIWTLVMRGWIWLLGLFFVTVLLTLVSTVCDMESLPAGIAAHVVSTALVAGASWWTCVYRLLRVFPENMRTAAWRVLRHDRLVRPTWLSLGWCALIQTITVLVPWRPYLTTGILICAWLSAFGYYIGRIISGLRLRRASRELEAKRQRQWRAVVN